MPRDRERVERSSIIAAQSWSGLGRTGQGRAGVQWAWVAQLLERVKDALLFPTMQNFRWRKLKFLAFLPNMSKIRVRYG